MFIDRLISVFTSLRLTVVCLVFAMALVFLGTLAQVEMGLYKAQNEFFRSFFVFWTPNGTTLRIPVFPGGYLVGGVLLINLVASHFKRFSLTWDKSGIWMVHFGLILLLVGQLLTDLLSTESTLHLREGQTKNYSENDREAELAVVEATDPSTDTVIAIPHAVLMSRSEVKVGEFPFTLKIQRFLPNSLVENRESGATEPPPATKGVGPQAVLKELPKVTETNKRDVPSAVVEVIAPSGSLGTWLVSEYVNKPQEFKIDNRSFQMSLRPRRHYKPFSLQLLEFRHDLYPGTEIPKNFSSRVLLQRPEKNESREVLIYMNNPLRYWGETFYQASFDPDNQGTVLQVVRNPSWLTPYFSCLLVGFGLVVQFAIHLMGFTFKRRTA